MNFKPCIDIHNGKVKQIVGGTLLDKDDYAKENFVSQQDASFYASLYKKDNLKGGHIILLNPENSEYYEATKEQALRALKAYPNGLQVGGGMNNENSQFYIENGATHVIVTSFVFKDGNINYQNLDKMKEAVGKKNLVLDLSCRQKNGNYYIVTDRWQKFTGEIVTHELLDSLSNWCDEFLIHAVDVEGKASGIEKKLASLLGGWDGIPITYAGGIGTFDDLEELKKLGKNKLDVTIGSALDLFGGSMDYQEVLTFMKK